MKVKMVPKYIASDGGYHIELEDDAVSVYKFGAHLFTLPLSDMEKMDELVNHVVFKRELDKRREEGSNGKD